MKLSQLQILQTLQVRPRCTTAASVARCCHPSPLWTVICWSTLVRDLSHAKFVVKHSPPMGTCTDTEEPTTWGTVVRAMVLVVLPRKWGKEKLRLPWCLPSTKSQSSLSMTESPDPVLTTCPSLLSNVQSVPNISTANCPWRSTSSRSILVKRSGARTAPTPAPPTTTSSSTATCSTTSPTPPPCSRPSPATPPPLLYPLHLPEIYRFWSHHHHHHRHHPHQLLVFCSRKRLITCHWFCRLTPPQSRETLNSTWVQI